PLRTTLLHGRPAPLVPRRLRCGAPAEAGRDQETSQTRAGDARDHQAQGALRQRCASEGTEEIGRCSQEKRKGVKEAARPASSAKAIVPSQVYAQGKRQVARPSLHGLLLVVCDHSRSCRQPRRDRNAPRRLQRRLAHRVGAHAPLPAHEGPHLHGQLQSRTRPPLGSAEPGQ
ncbi:hypothetical protein PENTCL1PPCAC_3509, partial [Pristionchus entomophagus]